jgi:hypothetical protein
MSKINKNCNLGDVVRVVFDDHSEGEQHIVFEVFGRVLRKDRRSLVIACWKYADNNDQDENMTAYTILRAAVKSLEILTPKEACQSHTANSKMTANNSPRKRANSAGSRQVTEKPANADTIPPEPLGSPESGTMIGVQSTNQTTT